LNDFAVHDVVSVADGAYSTQFREVAGRQHNYDMRARPGCGATNWQATVADRPASLTPEPGHSTVTGLNARACPSGTIRGRVTDAATGQPVAGASVEAWPLVAGAMFATTTKGTGPDGSFVIKQVAAVPNQVIFAGGRYMLDYAFQKPSADSADRIGVGQGQTVTVDESLHRTNVISGRVTSGLTGKPLAGIEVSTTQLSGSWHPSYGSEAVCSGVTDADGNYKICPVGSGTFAVCFYTSYVSAEETSLNNFPYAPRCYKDRPPNDPHHATPVPVRGFGITVSHIDEALLPYGVRFLSNQLRS
jgi:hypothetical protein